jgi:hypothetical protein
VLAIKGVAWAIAILALILSLKEVPASEIGSRQADPVSPDEVWPEAPAGWHAKTSS